MSNERIERKVLEDKRFTSRIANLQTALARCSHAAPKEGTIPSTHPRTAGLPVSVSPPLGAHRIHDQEAAGAHPAWCADFPFCFPILLLRLCRSLPLWHFFWQ